MNRVRRAWWPVLLLAGLVWSCDGAAPPPAREELDSFGRFGSVRVYRERPEPGHVVLLLSGADGWSARERERARSLAALDALVIGVDSGHYLRALASAPEPCAYPAGELESLSQFLQQKLGRSRYANPVLVGEGTGSALAYAALVQAPEATFPGAISVGFCAELPLQRPLCAGSGLVSRRAASGAGLSLAPAAALESPWIVLEPAQPASCAAGPAREFAAQVAAAQWVPPRGDAAPALSAREGEGESEGPELRDALARIASRTALGPAPGDAELRDLPLIEVDPRTPGSAALAVIVTGDGGWAGLDRALAAALAADGLPVIGLDSLRYFWTRRTPEQAARDLERILDHALARWPRERVILIGYSRGADVLPFMVSRLPARLRGRVSLVGLLGPSASVEFEFHVADWIRSPNSPAALPVGPEVAKLSGLRVLCLHGTEEADSLCPSLARSVARVEALPGGHHFDHDYPALAQRILRSAKE